MTKQWLMSAPECLVRAYESRDIGNGRPTLERLLRDERMRTTWAELALHVHTDERWLGVWNAIAYAKLKSNRAGTLRKQRSDERDAYQTLAGQFAVLAKKIENGPLDVLAYDLLPQDVLAALHVENLREMDSLQRSAVARRLLPCWPMASELLRGLEARALMLATDAMSKPRADDRDSGNVAARTFVWYLGEDFRAMFGMSMLGTLARITEVTFNSEGAFSKSFVQSALGGIAKRGATIVR